MILTASLRRLLPQMISLLQQIPDGQQVQFEDTGLVFQCATQAKVQALRACFPGCIWQKRYSDNCGWWEYNSTPGDLSLHIYACYEAPPTCKAIEEEYEVEEKVPTQFEMRRVTKTRIRWDCTGASQVEVPAPQTEDTER